MARRRRAVVAVLLVLGVLATAGIASAASLNVRTASLGAFTASHPCPGTLAATTTTTTGTASTVQVTAPAACASRLLRVAVDDGSVVREGTVTAPASGSVTVTLNGTYTPSTGVVVAGTVDGWSLAATWAYTPPAPPTTGPVTAGTSWTTIPSLTWPTLVNGRQACFAVTVSTSNTGGQEEWALVLDTNQRPFNGATTGYQIGGADGGRVRFASTTPTAGRLTIVGIGDDRKLRSPDSLSFSVCNYGTPAPAYDPALTYTVTQSAPSTDWSPCTTVTVAVTGTPLFYAGWRADVDMAPAIAAIRAAGGVWAGTVSVRTGDVSAQLLTGTTWRATGTGWNTAGVRDGSPQSFTMCADRR